MGDRRTGQIACRGDLSGRVTGGGVRSDRERDGGCSAITEVNVTSVFPRVPAVQ